MKREKSIKVKVISIFTVLCALIVLINVSLSLLLPFYLSYKYNIDTRDAHSVEIIGSADGLTSVFVSGHSSLHWYTAVFALLTVLGIIYLVNNKRNKN